MKKIYVCNDTITGIFSAIYDAWKEGREEKECGIAIKGMLEQELFCEYMLVEEESSQGTGSRTIDPKTSRRTGLC